MKTDKLTWAGWMFFIGCTLFIIGTSGVAEGHYLAGSATALAGMALWLLMMYIFPEARAGGGGKR